MKKSKWSLKSNLAGNSALLRTDLQTKNNKRFMEGAKVNGYFYKSG